MVHFFRQIHYVLLTEGYRPLTPSLSLCRRLLGSLPQAPSIKPGTWSYGRLRCILLFVNSDHVRNQWDLINAIMDRYWLPGARCLVALCSFSWVFYFLSVNIASNSLPFGSDSTMLWPRYLTIPCGQYLCTYVIASPHSANPGIVEVTRCSNILIVLEIDSSADLKWLACISHLQR